MKWITNYCGYMNMNNLEILRNSVYYENAHVILQDENIFRVQCSYCPFRITFQLMDDGIEKPEVVPVSVDPHFANYIHKDFLSDVTPRKQSGIMMQRFSLHTSFRAFSMCSLKLALQARNKFGFVDELQETYDKVDGSVVYNLLQKVNTVKQGGCSVADYYHRLNSLWREFDALTKIPKCVCDGKDDCCVFEVDVTGSGCLGVWVDVSMGYKVVSRFGRPETAADVTRDHACTQFNSWNEWMV
nr:paired amphipathic helix protein Sin3-like 2 isoform X1 [Tanacetum cinerariifolium]